MQTAQGKTFELTEAMFEDAVRSEGILLIDWWASWCGPCKRFAPVFEAAAARYPEIRFGKVDTEAQQGLAGAAGISSIPTLMIFRDGILLFSQPGALPGDALDDLIGQVVALDMDKVRADMEAHEAAHGHDHDHDHGGGCDC